VRAFIFKPLSFWPFPFWYVKRPFWRFPKWSGNGRNSQKWAREDAIFEASFSALTQGNFKDDQILDFLDHPNGQNHIVGSQWDGLGPLSWKILVLGVRPILSLPTSLKWANYKTPLALISQWWKKLSSSAPALLCSNFYTQLSRSQFRNKRSRADVIISLHHHPQLNLSLSLTPKCSHSFCS